MDTITDLHDNPNKWVADLATAKAEVLAFIEADKVKREGRPVTSNQSWQFSNSNFGMGL